MTKKLKIAVGITGASGSIYANELLKSLNEYRDQIEEVSVVMSSNAKIVWETELGTSQIETFDFKLYDKMDFYSPIASGSANYDVLIICPCSMGTMARIANGMSNDLLTRAADVMLKERRKLILATRETPLNLIQIENMKKITLAGGIIAPASPSFYSNPSDFSELVKTVTDRILDLSGLKVSTFRWSASSHIS